MAEEIHNWLKNLGLVQYAQAFDDHAIDMAVIGDLDDQDLEKIGVAALGHRKKLLKAIQKINTSRLIDDKIDGSKAERRQITVMFCDLVGSTALSSRLDPEDMSATITSFQKIITEKIERFDGYIARYMGDGVLCYFGWPHAHEDDAERAARAGLEIISALKPLKTCEGKALEARIGIATGLVVVGEVVGNGAAQEETVVGETPNLAARLQGIARPGQVVISDATRNLLGKALDFVELEPQSLKGFDRPVLAWEVAGVSQVESRFEAARNDTLSAMVGREGELNNLHKLWREAVNGKGRVVFISGEAGIGKSRLLAAISDDLTKQDLGGNNPFFRIRYHCSPNNNVSAFYPVIEQLRRAAAINPDDDDDDTKLDKLEHLSSFSRDRDKKAYALFANLLSLPFEHRYGALELTPAEIKQATLDLLADELKHLSRIKPVLFLFEDVHWIDPTSGDLLSQLMDKVLNDAVLLIVTHRPNWQPDIFASQHISSLNLHRLGRKECTTIARAVAGNDLSDNALEFILARTDGIPLFAEELTKALVESNFKLTGHDVPATLQASLLARLDKLGEKTKEIAQIGAVIGREFPTTLLSEVVGCSDQELDQLMNRLLRSGLVLMRGTEQKTIYSFKHALVQDTTYGSLLRTQRQKIHKKIAKVLEEKYADIQESQPELLAHHFGCAGHYGVAIDYWRKSATRAVNRSAVLEALDHSHQALELLGQLPDEEERDRLELDLRIAEGVPAINVYGYASPEVERIYLRARELSVKLDDAIQLFPIERGLWNLYVDRSDLEKALKFARGLVHQAESQGNMERVALAHRALGFSYLQLGMIGEARTALENGIAAMKSHGKIADLPQYGEDGGLASSQYLAWVDLADGFPIEARNRSMATIASSDQLDHAVCRAFARSNAATLLVMIHDVPAVLQYAKEFREIAFNHNLIFWEILARRSWAWAKGKTGELDEGLEMLRQVETDWAAIDALVMRTQHQALHADLLIDAGDYKQALIELDKGLGFVDRFNDRWYEAELLRFKAIALNYIGNKADACICFDKAIDVAVRQKNRWWQLRASRSKASWLIEEGHTSEAKALLSPIADNFSTGFELADLKEVKSILR